MKRIIFLLVLLITKPVLSQTTFVVDNFSEDYYGKLHIDNAKEVFSEGWVAIFDKKSKKQLIKIDSDELTFSLHEGKVLANIKEIPYGEQSQIIYQDFNFDGKKDFALMDGQNSCYHGPSFQIFLATDKGFENSPEFTELAQNYCGMFDVDHKAKTIHTMTKSGCCWHQYSEFKVKSNKPYPIKIVEEGLSPLGITLDHQEQNLVNGKMIFSSYQTLVLEDNKDNSLLFLELENKKKMRLIVSESILFYVFTDANDRVELIYRDKFKYSSSQNTLSFTNRDTEYIIYDDKIVVKTPQKTYIMKAKISNKNSNKYGTLTKLNNIKVENLTN